MKTLAVLFWVLLFAGCKMSSFYPAAGAVGGAAVGSIGGVGGAAGGSALGWSLGKGAQLLDENERLASTVESLSHGDVEALVAAGLGETTSGFESFVSTVKRILVGAGVFLLVWLCIPFFWTKKCVKDAVTRPPFPTTGRSQ